MIPKSNKKTKKQEKSSRKLLKRLTKTQNRLGMSSYDQEYKEDKMFEKDLEQVERNYKMLNDIESRLRDYLMEETNSLNLPKTQ